MTLGVFRGSHSPNTLILPLLSPLGEAGGISLVSEWPPGSGGGFCLP